MNYLVILLILILGAGAYEYYVGAQIGRYGPIFRRAIRYVQGNLWYAREYLFVRTYLFVNEATARKQEEELARIERKRRRML